MAQDEYRCDLCGATFGSQAELNEHNRKEHARYMCEFCGTIFGSEDDLEQHYREKHPNQLINPR